ncbi:MAG: rhodanese-like domain-containing protein [Chitinophagaceae bacterium]|nr:rhodanese-like domain-containing protein [Chitinophagaceae bacterium]
MFVVRNQRLFYRAKQYRFSYSKITPATYAAILKDSSNYYLIDVRTAAEYKRSHLPGAVNFSYLNFHFGRDVDSLDRNKPVLVYCQTCHRSPLAARKMKRLGFRKVYDLKGGYQKWTGRVKGDEPACLSVNVTT